MEKAKTVSIPRMVSTLYRAGLGYMGKKLEPLKIGGGQYTFLVHLYENDGINQECLCSRLNVDKATTARALKVLEDEGYIYKTADEKDGRAWHIRVTEKAKAVEPEIRKVIKEWADILLAGFTEEEKEGVSQTLGRLMENVCPKKEINGENR